MRVCLAHPLLCVMHFYDCLALLYHNVCILAVKKVYSSSSKVAGGSCFLVFRKQQT